MTVSTSSGQITLAAGAVGTGEVTRTVVISTTGGNLSATNLGSGVTATGSATNVSSLTLTGTEQALSTYLATAGRVVFNGNANVYTLTVRAQALNGSQLMAETVKTATLTAANMNEWRKHIEARLAEKYPKMKLVDTKPCDDQKDKAQQETTNLLGANPNLKCIMAICSPAVLGSAEAVKQAGKGGAVKVLGLGLPSENKAYLADGITQSVILWKVADLGYLALHAAHALGSGALKPGDTSIKAGRLGELPIDASGSIILGKPFVFNKENVEQFDF
jgi:hypothetical protein